MPRPTKRSALRSLTKPRLQSLVEHFGVDISRNSAPAKLLDALARAKAISRDELEEICEALIGFFRAQMRKHIYEQLRASQ